MARKHQNRSFKRIKVKTTSGVKVHYRLAKPSKAICAVTGQKLNGVPRERPFRMKTMAKTMKRPERPYGGVLSSKAMRELFLEKARSM
jgi:large subunit ribosomal protein L34e